MARIVQIVSLVLAVAAILFWYAEHRTSSDEGTETLLVKSSQIKGSRPWLFAPASSAGVSRIEIASSRPATAVDRQSEKSNAANDDWVGEVLSQQAKGQLGTLKKWFETFGESGEIDLGGLTVEEVSTVVMARHDLDEVYAHANLTILRATGESPSVTTIGRVALTDGLARIVENLAPGSIRAAIKIVGIRLASKSFETDVLVVVSGKTDTSTVQTNARWLLRWSRAGEEQKAPPRLTAIEWGDMETATLLNSGERMFSDGTQSALGKTVSYQGQVMHGIGYWSRRLSRLDDMHIFGHHGLAVGDANGDGLDDIYVCDGGGLPNRLYMQNGDGTLRDVSSQSAVDWLEESRAALFLDLDNDGDQDLVVATVALLLVVENTGAGKFKLRGGYQGPVDCFSICAADYDQDGLLDLYCCGYGAAGASGGPGNVGYEALSPLPFNDARNGGANVLFRGKGDLRFVNATKEAGFGSGNSRWSFAASWEDFDDDGDPDLYVANDFGRNNLYRNDDGRFTDVAQSVGVEDMSGGMSVDWGDWNRDGRMDVYVGNMYSAAGNRIMYQRRFASSHGKQTNDLRRMARGNTLFTSSENGHFQDSSEEQRVAMGRWAWGSKFADLNNDGWSDLVVANGYISNRRNDDL